MHCLQAFPKFPVSLEPMNIDIMGDGCTRYTKLQRLDNIKKACKVDEGMGMACVAGARWSTWSEEFMSRLVMRHPSTLHESIQAEAREAAAKAMITNDYQWLTVLMIKSQFAQKGDRIGGNVAVTWHDFKQLCINIAVHCRQVADEMGAPHRQHDRLIEDMQMLLAHDSDLPAVG